MGNCFTRSDGIVAVGNTDFLCPERRSRLDYEVIQRLLRSTNSAADGVIAIGEERKEQIVVLKKQMMISHLPCREYKDDDITECSICIEDFVNGDMVRCLPCFHSFHQNCIDDWLSRSFTCPMCQESVGSALLLSFSPPD